MLFWRGNQPPPSVPGPVHTVPAQPPVRKCTFVTLCRTHTGLFFHKRPDPRLNPGKLIDTIPNLVQARRVPVCATFSTPRFFETLHERSRGLANYWTSVALRFDTSFATLRHSCLALPGALAAPDTPGRRDVKRRGNEGYITRPASSA